MQDQANVGENRPPIRLWPGVAAMAVGWGLRLVAPLVAPEYAIVGFLGLLVCGLAVFFWWMFFSRIPPGERWGGLLLVVVAMAAAPRTILHESIVGGMMGLMPYVVTLPVVALALVAWAAASRRMAQRPRRSWLAASILAACGVFALFRTDGVMGEGGMQLRWRWTETPEQRLLARAGMPAPPVVAPQPNTDPAAEPAPAAAKPPPVLPATAAEPPVAPEWPGFRGPNRDSVVAGTRIKTDWTASPPVEMWRKPVGPGWSSFAVGNGRIYTQEQRGEHELVACYNTATGEPLWVHRDTTRFWESNAGAGPRATPELHGGRVYALGATGILNALDARTGEVIWTRNAAADTGAELPVWGFSGSPVVVDDMVLVATSGRLAAYRVSNGEAGWTVKSGGGSYSSPHLATIGGMKQVVLLNSAGAAAFAPADGAVLWKHAWEGASMLQPAMLDGDALLITTATASGGVGTRRLAVQREGGAWKVDEVWTSRGLKPYFNDLVVHKGHAYGFDGSILACIDLKDGARTWKGGRYGHGQMLLLRDQDLLLVLTERGEVALVAATPADYKEVARFHAIQGKTWNHPVVVRNVLLMRNGEEMAAFRLPADGG